MTTPARRASPLAPDERRDALVEVFLRLARREGRVPTTREIATEAGVAEGTIFRVFATKEALEDDAIQVAFCPAPIARELAAIDRTQSMRDCLIDFTAVIQRRFSDVFGLMAALGLTQPPNREGHSHCFASGRHQRCVVVGNTATGDTGEAGAPVQDYLHDMMVAVLETHRDELVVPPDGVIHRIRLLTFSGSHPGIADGRLLSPEEIVDTILDGVRTRPCPHHEYAAHVVAHADAHARTSSTATAAVEESHRLSNRKGS
ncbi:MAG: TetR/AcrR family transcriptional regulator [Dermatophilaceae bacterium]